MFLYLLTTKKNIQDGKKGALYKSHTVKNNNFVGEFSVIKKMKLSGCAIMSLNISDENNTCLYQGPLLCAICIPAQYLSSTEFEFLV
jgi:hypothetical protein